MDYFTKLHNTNPFAVSMKVLEEKYQSQINEECKSY